MRIDKLIRDSLVGKTLIAVEFTDYDDLEYFKSIDVIPAILPSKIVNVNITNDEDGDVQVYMVLENGTIANAYDTEEITVEE